MMTCCLRIYVCVTSLCDPVQDMTGLNGSETTAAYCAEFSFHNRGYRLFWHNPPSHIIYCINIYPKLLFGNFTLSKKKKKKKS